MQVREPSRLQRARHSPETRTLPKPLSSPLPSFTSACPWALSRPGDGCLDNPLQISTGKTLAILGRMTHGCTVRGILCGECAQESTERSCEVGPASSPAALSRVTSGKASEGPKSAAPWWRRSLWSFWVSKTFSLCEMPHMLGLSGNRRLYANIRYLLSLIWDKFLRHLLELYLLFSELLRVGPGNDLLSRGVSSPQLASLLPV